MKRFLTILITVCVCVLAQAQQSYDAYIKSYSDMAVSEMYRSGIPASITLAQGLLESAAGGSVLARMGNNHFGIKCAGTWTGQRIYHDDDEKGECFRKYQNVKDSYKDHSDFLRYSQRYQSLFDLEITDYKGWANGLKAAGYATDPSYPIKLIKIIEDYKLYEFDTNGRTATAAREEREERAPKRQTTQTTKQPEEDVVPEVIPESPTVLQQAVKSNFRFSLSRPVYEVNGVPFIYVQEGETIDSIARDYELFRKEIMKFNDMTAARELVPGERLYLRPKNLKAVRGLEKHVVESDDETLYEISQHYAIKMKSLRKMNAMTDMTTLREGIILNLR